MLSQGAAAMPATEAVTFHQRRLAVVMHEHQRAVYNTLAIRAVAVAICEGSTGIA